MSSQCFVWRLLYNYISPAQRLINQSDQYPKTLFIVLALIYPLILQHLRKGKMESSGGLHNLVLRDNQPATLRTRSSGQLDSFTTPTVTPDMSSAWLQFNVLPSTNWWIASGTQSKSSNYCATLSTGKVNK